MALGLLTFKFNAFLKNSRPGSIETIKNELKNVSIFKANMDHMYLISRNADEGSINLVYPRIIAAETPHKYHLRLVEAMKSDDGEDFITVMEKEIKYLTTEDVWEMIPKSLIPTSAHVIRLLWSVKRKINPFRELIKHKARVFEHGGMVDFHNTFAPVVNWFTVMFIIIMAEIYGW